MWFYKKLTGAYMYICIYTRFILLISPCRRRVYCLLSFEEERGLYGFQARVVDQV